MDIMLYAILIILILLAIAKPSSKKMAFLLIAFGTLLCAFCTESFDLRNYKAMFETPEVYGEKLAFGWDIYLDLSIKSGMSFTAFKALCSLITFVLTFFAMNKMTEKSTLVLGLYMLGLFLGQITQIRFYMASSMALVGISYLAQNKRYSVVKYLFWMILAISFHYSMVFGFIALFVKIWKNPKTLLRFVFILIVCESALFYSNALYNIALSIIPNEMRVLQYLDFSKVLTSLNIHTIKPILILILSHLAVFCGCRAIYKYSIMDSRILIKSGVQLNRRWLSQIEFLYKIEIGLLILMPLYFRHNAFYRIFKNFIILIFVMASTLVVIKGKNKFTLRKIFKRGQLIAIASSVLVLLVVGFIDQEWFSVLDSFTFSM